MKTMKRKLMKSTIDAIEPGGKDNICWDTEITGLALKTTPAGRKSFFYVYRTASGQQRKPKIGSYGTFTVKTARDVARKWAADIALGGDPSRDRQDKRASPDVKALAEQYLKEHAIPHKKASSVAGDRRNLDLHVLPALGGLKVADVTIKDIGGMHRKIGSTAGPIVANRVLTLVTHMLNLAEGW